MPETDARQRTVGCMWEGVQAFQIAVRIAIAADSHAPQNNPVGTGCDTQSPEPTKMPGGRALDKPGEKVTMLPESETQR